MYGPHPPPSLANRFARVLQTACDAIRAKLGKPGAADELLCAIYWHLKKVVTRFIRLAELARTGMLLPPRKRTPPPADAVPVPLKPREKPLLRKSGYAWIVKHVQYASAAGSQLRVLLEDPEMIALIALDPRFAALLRPLCAGLCTDIPQGRLPPPPPRAGRAIREPKPPVPKPPRKQRAKKVRWWCAKPPRAGLIFSDESLN